MSGTDGATKRSEERPWTLTSALSLGPIRVCVPLSDSLALEAWDALLTHNTQPEFLCFKEAQGGFSQLSELLKLQGTVIPYSFPRSRGQRVCSLELLSEALD